MIFAHTYRDEITVVLVNTMTLTSVTSLDSKDDLNTGLTVREIITKGPVLHV